MKDRLLSLTLVFALAAVIALPFAMRNVRADGSDTRNVRSATALSAVPLDGSGASLVFTVDTSESAYGNISFWFTFDYTANAGIISLTCTGGPTAADDDYTLTVCDSTSTEGECSAKTSGIFKSEGSLSADTKWDGRMGLRGARAIECTAAQSGSPGASETLTVIYVISE